MFKYQIIVNETDERELNSNLIFIFVDDVGVFNVSHMIIYHFSSFLTYHDIKYTTWCIVLVKKLLTYIK